VNWNKIGKIDILKWISENKFVSEFATLPTPIHLNNDVIRIYVGFCDKNSVGRVGYVDVDADNPSQIIRVSNTPVLDLGRPGCFDDNGVVPLSVLRVDNLIYLYYVGFQLAVKIPYFMFGGLAISYDNGDSFERVSENPILDRKNDELFARCGMYVMKDEDMYKMWYIGTMGKGWTKNNSSLKPLYTMRYMYSEDGIHWEQNSQICMSFKNADEHGFGRPYVWKDESGYKMLYSIRTYSQGYYIGYAESIDEINWIRKDDLAGIQISKKGWDSINISYPVAIQHKEKKYLFYNGNGCGKTGFGYAELEI